ncbi:MAG TPA: MBL fold metallo-hydrolase [Prolixibacteraceae bacterium]|nr:MBL fold metallo-hydrolase [Prolixibacteraceae bacterium]
MVEVCALASGSNGNCYYIGNESEAILIDAGINCKQLLIRMAERNLDPAKVKAVFISHEHHDHICGVRVFCNKLKIPAYFTPGTFVQTTHSNRPRLYRFVEIGESAVLGKFRVHCFAKSHDAADPCSFRIETDSIHVGVLTDLGSYDQPVIDQVKKCHILFLESNYDEKMLREGPYSWPLKKRIASERGHLSNVQALNLIEEHAGENLHTIILSHLSGENNTSEIAFNTFSPLSKMYSIICSSRNEPGNIIIG